MSFDLTPKPEHKFTFGLWTVGSTGLRSIRYYLPPFAVPNPRLTSSVCWVK